MTSLSLLV